MSKYDKKYYENHKDELKAKQIEYYYKHRDEIIAKRNANKEEYLAKRKEWEKKRKESQKEYQKEYKESLRTPTAKLKEFLKPFKAKYKGFTFDVTDGTAIVIEIKLPFRIFKYISSNRVCDDEAYGKIQNELRRKVAMVYKHRNIIVVECQFIQIHIMNTENLEELCAVTKEFIEDKMKIYGQYTKNGKKIATSLELNIN